jgi:hypothetical protein
LLGTFKNQLPAAQLDERQSEMLAIRGNYDLFSSKAVDPRLKKLNWVTEGSSCKELPTLDWYYQKQSTSALAVPCCRAQPHPVGAFPEGC